LAGAGSAAGPALDEFPVSFTLTSATCPLLPSGTTIEGSGTEKSITNVRTDRNGRTTIMNTTHAFGTATDQAGNSYVFNYSNSFSVSNTGPTDPVASAGASASPAPPIVPAASHAATCRRRLVVTAGPPCP
jgi:hypothetical protein